MVIAIEYFADLSHCHIIEGKSFSIVDIIGDTARSAFVNKHITGDTV